MFYAYFVLYLESSKSEISDVLQSGRYGRYSPFRKPISEGPWFLLKLKFTILVPDFREVWYKVSTEITAKRASISVEDK